MRSSFSIFSTIKSTFSLLHLFVLPGLLSFLPIFSAGQSFTCGGPVNYNGQVYTTVQIGNLCWMNENMETRFYANGNTIPTALLYHAVPYQDTIANLNNFGRLYS